MCRPVCYQNISLFFIFLTKSSEGKKYSNDLEDNKDNLELLSIEKRITMRGATKELDDLYKMILEISKGK